MMIFVLREQETVNAKGSAIGPAKCLNDFLVILAKEGTLRLSP
jgi:hypothetical protein